MPTIVSDMPDGFSLSRVLRDLKTSIRREMHLSKVLSHRPTFKQVAKLPVELEHRYFITTDKGIFRAEGDQLIQVTPWRLYGFSIHGEHAYCAVTVKKWSLLLKCRLDALINESVSPEWEELSRYEAPDTNCRYHGMDVDSSSLWLAHTGRGGLLKFDLKGSNSPKEISLFTDHFGEPIQYDLNHINGITAYEDFTLFTSYKIGKTSGIGILEGDTVTVFPVPNRGIHDAFFIGDDVYHCDTFGSSQCGCLMRNNELVDPDYFSKPPGFIIRGAAGTQDEMLLGHSHKGERKTRFKGNGSILFLRDHKVQAKIDFHGSQVYQIIREDGVALSPKPRDMSSEKAKAMLTQVFGSPVYENKSITV